MKILYVTCNVLGDSGANAAELFPKLAAESNWAKQVIVADFRKNENYVEEQQKAEFLCLWQSWPQIRESIHNARQIAWIVKHNDVNIIHIFYREQNVPLLTVLRLLILWYGCDARIIMDHRSVNLARGYRSFRKKLVNIFAMLFSHKLVGNPLAVESNHFFEIKDREIVDLGYDDTVFPNISGLLSPDLEAAKNKPVNVWFVGSIKPANRKSWFLIEIFRAFSDRFGTGEVVFNIAGPANIRQIAELEAIPTVNYLGVLPRGELYAQMKDKPGIGMAFMNKEFHDLAPSLKFVEYALFGYKILASSTVGLKKQAERMKFENVHFVDETVDDWCSYISQAAKEYQASGSVAWKEGPNWSYRSIFERQVRTLYEDMRSSSGDTVILDNSAI